MRIIYSSLEIGDWKAKKFNFMIKRFEDLLAWQKSRELVKLIYLLTKQEYISRDFGLTNQLQRAAVSMMTNIAEGFERTHLKEKIQFYNVARASGGEIRSLIYVVIDIYPALKETCDHISTELDNTGQLISGLIQSTINHHPFYRSHRDDKTDS